MPSDGNTCWVNGGEAFDHMHAIKDPAVKNLIKLVYTTVVQRDLQGVRPAAPFDLLYCFRVLEDAFASRAEVVTALWGDLPGSDESPDWI